MAKLEGMTIQGIRSFGPEDTDKGAVMFFTPLTLILGPNGTGKTTIIECLKYMTTGAMPPGCQKGGAFIHDPKIARDLEVKAQVCLQFRDVRGQRCIAKRSLVATQKKTNIQMKTLDGFIKRTLPNGDIADVSSKCAEMDREMVSLLGVSHAILDNVIFCHQEESNWPLSEGSALKKKFDDIFASTRYVKALDAIRKFRQEQTTVIREYQAEIKYLKQNKDKASEIRSNLADREERHKAAADCVKKVVEKLAPVEDKLMRLKDQEDEIQEIKNKIDILKGSRAQMDKAQLELKTKIKQEFKDSTAELRRQIDDFTEKVSTMERNLKQNLERLESLDRELSKLGQEKSKLQSEQGRLQAEAERHTNVIKSRDATVKQLTEKYSLSECFGPINDGAVKKVLSDLEEKAKTVLATTQNKKAEHDGQIERYNREIDSKRQSKTRLETEQKMKLDRLKSNQQEIRKMNNELSRVDLSAGRLTDIDRDISRIEMEFSETQKATDLESMKTEIQQLQKEKLSMDSNLKQLDIEMNQLTQESTVRTQLEVFTRDKTAKEDQIRRLKAKNEDTLKHVLGSVPEEACGKALDRYIRERNEKVRSTTETLQKLRSRFTMLETTRKMENESLSKKQEELRSFMKQITDATQGMDFDQGLDTIQNKLKGYNDQKGHLTAIEYLFKKYIEKLHAPDPNCPLCHRPFDEQSEVTELIEEMENKLVAVPAKLDKLSNSITESKKEYEDLLQLKPKRDMVKEKKEKDIPHLESTIQSLAADILKLQEEISEKDEELEADSNDESVAKSLQPDVMLIDRLITEVSELNRKIDVQNAKLSSDSRRTLQEVQTERSNLQLNMDQLSVRLEHKRQSLFQQTELMQKLRSELNDLRSAKVQIESELQQRSRLEQNKEELISANEILETEIEEAKHQVQPIQEEIERLVERKESLVQTREQQFEQGREQHAEVRNSGERLQAFQTEIDRYMKEGKAELLASSRSRVEQNEEEMKKSERRRSQLSETIDKNRQELASQELDKRDLEDNLQLRKNQEEIDATNRRIAGEEQKLGGVRVDNLTREKQELKREYEKLDRERDTARSRQQVLEGEIVAFQRDLKEDMYKDADEKYRVKKIALRTTELANTDLDKYYKALDGTIMSYHNQKMAEINKIISELWRNTYRGNDIETIQIRSDDDGDEGSGAAKSRRQYKYRVIMIKQATELDMRGRCSAGQKVLASLIIRLALAETFCLNFGVLALDEPTTNLDRENIMSLACALDKIIRSRSQQRNFQLIVITHDEDFLELLGRSDHADEFFKVEKTSAGCSRLIRASIQDVRSK